MSGRRRILASPIVPAVLCAALSAALYQQVVRPPSVAAGLETTMAAEASGSATTTADPFVLPPIAAFSEIVRRPVFSPTRRPPAGVEPESDNAGTAPLRQDGLDVEVVGIITGPRDLALLRSSSSDRLMPMAEGDELSGWTLIEIEPFRLVFQRDDDQRTFEIEHRDD